MNEREEFLQYFRSVFVKMVEQIGTMTGTQVLDGLQEVKAVRNIYEEEFTERIDAMIQPQVRERPRVVAAGLPAGEALAYLCSIQAFLNSVDKPRSQLGAKARPGGSPPCLFDSLEDALKERLETLKKRPQ